MAKHRINDLKQYMYQFKKEILKNYHLKEVTKRHFTAQKRGYLEEKGASNGFFVPKKC